MTTVGSLYSLITAATTSKYITELQRSALGYAEVCFIAYECNKIMRLWSYTVCLWGEKNLTEALKKKFNILEKINLFAFPTSEGWNRETRNPFAWICLKSGGQTLHKVFEDPFSDSMPRILQQINLFLSVLNSCKGEVFFNLKPLLCISYRSSSPMHRSLTQRSYRL